MEQPAASPEHTSAPPRSNQFKTYGICFLAGVLIALVPTGIGLVQTQRERDALQRQLRVANLEMNLASAAVMARQQRHQVVGNLLLGQRLVQNLRDAGEADLSGHGPGSAVG